MLRCKSEDRLTSTFTVFRNSDSLKRHPSFLLAPMTTFNDTISYFNIGGTKVNELEELTGTKKKILEAAIELFSRKGYSDVSVRELTGEVGIKESSLYNHFKSKEAILEMIYCLFQQQNANAFPSVNILPDLVKVTSVEVFLQKGLENFKKTVEDPLHEKMWRILNIEKFKDQRARNIILISIMVRSTF